MQKINKVFLSLIIFCLVSLLMPFNISADSATYYVITSDPIQMTSYKNQNAPQNYYLRASNANETRLTVLKYNNDLYYYTVVQGSSNVTQYHQGLDTSGSWSNVSYQGNRYVNSVQYTLKRSDQSLNYWNYVFDLTPIELTAEPSWSDGFYYTFGDGAVDPGPSINYGELIVGFHTNFSASGTTNNYTITSNTNLDTIEWENIDANGNDLQNKGINVEIRAVPILYTANSKSALDLLGFQDAVVESNNGLILWQGNFNDNHKSFIWNDVINQLQTSNPAFAITSLLTGSVWTRYGWIYQIRYNDVLNGYSSQWQTIYNSTSIKVSDSEKIVNQYYYHYPSSVGSDDQDIFHDINTVNNTTNNWYVNDVPVDPDASWLDALIQAIAEILGKILDFFSSIFDGLVDLILGLFGDINPADSFFNWFSDLFNGIGDIDLTLPEFNLPNADLTSFNRLVQETLNIFSLNNFGFVIFIPLLLLIIKAVF